MEKSIEKRSSGLNISGILAALCALTVVLAYGVWMELHTLEFDDEFYNIINGRDWRGVPFAPLSAWLTGVFGRMVDWHFVPFRMLTLGLYTLSVLIAGWYFYRRTGRPALALGVVDVCLLLSFCLRGGDWYFFGWNAFAYPIAILLIVSTLCMFERPTVFRAVLVGAVGGLLALCRMPSGVVLLALPLFVLLNRPRRPWLIVALTMGSAAVVGLGGLLLMYGSPQGWLEAVRSNVLTDHDMHYMMEYYIDYVVMTAVFLGAYYAIYVLFGYVWRRYHNRWAVLLTGCLVFYVLFAQGRLLNCLYHYQYYIMLATGLMPLFAVMVLYPRTWRSGPCLAMLVVLMLSSATCIGSNLGLSKYITFAAMPIVMVWFLPKMDRALYYATVVIFAAYILVSWRENERKASMHTRLWESVEETGVPALGSVKVPPREAEMVRSQYQDFMPYVDDENYSTFVVGNHSPHYYREYLFNCNNEYMRHRWGLTENYDDPEYVAYIEATLDSMPRPRAILYCVDCEADENTTMSRMLAGRLHQVSRGEWYIIFTDPEE